MCLDKTLLLQVSWYYLCMKNLGLIGDFDTVDQTDLFYIVLSGKGNGLRLVMTFNSLGIVIDMTSLSQAELKSKVLVAGTFNVCPSVAPLMGLGYYKWFLSTSTLYRFIFDLIYID